MSGAPKFAIIAALPREVRGLVGSAEPDPSRRRHGIYLYQLPEAIVVTAGMGAARAALAFGAAAESGPLRQVVSAGLAGACSAKVAVGSVVEARVVIDARTGERFPAWSTSDAVLVTTDTIAGVREKARLATSYGAAMVDMEAATVARLAAGQGLGFCAVKGISDAHDFELASLARFAGHDGRFKTAHFAAHTALRPQQWRRAATLGRNSNRALRALHARLWELLAELESQSR